GREAAQVFDEQPRLADIVRHFMENAAEALYPALPRFQQGFDLAFEAVMLGTAGGDGAGNAGQAGDEGGFGRDVGFGDIDFHMERRNDAQRFGLGEILLARPGAVELVARTDPGIAEAVRIDQVQMGIENMQGGPPFADILREGPASPPCPAPPPAGSPPDCRPRADGPGRRDWSPGSNDWE